MASRGRKRQETALLSHRAAWVVHHSTSPAAQEGRTAFLAGYSATACYSTVIARLREAKVLEEDKEILTKIIKYYQTY